MFICQVAGKINMWEVENSKETKNKLLQKHARMHSGTPVSARVDSTRVCVHVCAPPPTGFNYYFAKIIKNSALSLMKLRNIMNAPIELTYYCCVFNVANIFLLPLILTPFFQTFFLVSKKGILKKFTSFPQRTNFSF